MILVRLLKVKENNRVIYKATLGDCLLVLRPDSRSPDLILEIEKNDQPGLFTKGNGPGDEF